MSFLTVRGGVPHVFKDTITTTGRKHQFPAPSQAIAFRAATNPLKVYFSEADFDNDAGYISIPAGVEKQYSIETPSVWLKGDGGNSVVELYVFMRLV